MATLDTIIAYDVQSLQTFDVYDASDYTGGDILDVNGVRLLFSTVKSVAEAQTSVTSLVAYVEYEVISGSVTISGIVYSAGDLIVLDTDFTGSVGAAVINETGRYCEYASDNLPSSGIPWSYTPSTVNRPAVNTTYFADEVYILDYEQYTTKYVAGDSVPSGTYLCVGDSIVVGGVPIPKGNVYKPGGSITFSGSGYLAEYSTEDQFYFTTTGQAFETYTAYLQAKAIAVNPDQSLDSNLLDVAALYGSVELANDQTEGIGLQQLQDNLDRINNYYAANV